MPLKDAVPFGPSFDVVGWFARDAALLERTGRVLLRDRKQTGNARRLLVASDAVALVDGAVFAALRPAVARLEALIGEHEKIELSSSMLESGLGADVISSYIKLRQAEWNEYAGQLTDWERRTTLDC